MEKKEWVALSVGGSLLNDGKPDMKMAKSLAAIFKSCNKNLAIAVGGGKEARIAANAARKKFGSEFEADLAAIKITRKNADALRAALGTPAGKKTCLTFEEAKERAKEQKYVLMGGTIPGITTDADAALLAESLRSKRLINLSKAAIYDRDPSKNPNAKKFSRMSYARLASLAIKSDKRKAGTNFVFDLLACSLIARSRIRAHFIDGRIPIEVKNAILGRKHGGTVVG